MRPVDQTLRGPDGRSLVCQGEPDTAHGERGGRGDPRTLLMVSDTLEVSTLLTGLKSSCESSSAREAADTVSRRGIAVAAALATARGARRADTRAAATREARKRAAAMLLSIPVGSSGNPQACSCQRSAEPCAPVASDGRGSAGGAPRLALAGTEHASHTSSSRGAGVGAAGKLPRARASWRHSGCACGELGEESVPSPLARLAARGPSAMSASKWESALPASALGLPVSPARAWRDVLSNCPSSRSSQRDTSAPCPSPAPLPASSSPPRASPWPGAPAGVQGAALGSSDSA